MMESICPLRVKEGGLAYVSDIEEMVGRRGGAGGRDLLREVAEDFRDVRDL